MAQKIKKEAIAFTQTERKGWVLTLTPGELLLLVPPRGPEQLSFFTETNRPIVPRHLGEIEKFLLNTPEWALPPITLAATPDTITASKTGIELDPENLRILDGQHRLEAIANLIHQWNIQGQDPTAQEALNNFKAQQLPTTVFEVKDNRDQRQLFAWFARSKPIEPAVRDYFDTSEPYNQVAKGVMEESSTLHNNVTWKMKNVPPRDRQIMSLSNLRDIAIAINLGVARPPKKQDREALSQTESQEKLQAQLMDFFDNFLPTCTPNYEVLSDLTTLNANILSSRSRSFALDPRITRLFANTWARWQEDKSQAPQQPLAKAIGNLNLNRASPENDVEFTLQLANDKRRLHGLRHKSWQEATSSILRMARE